MTEEKKQRANNKDGTNRNIGKCSKISPAFAALAQPIYAPANGEEQKCLEYTKPQAGGENQQQPQSHFIEVESQE
jgi:hypothetical protein